MPATLEPIEAFAALPQKKWTRDECLALERAGFLDLADYELIEGDLLLKMSKNYPHGLALLYLSNWLRKIFGDLHVIQENALILRAEDAPTSEPEPDLMVLNQPYPALGGKASAADVLLVAEVSGPSLRFDLTRKAELYARSNVSEYWVLDLVARRVIIHRDPSRGHYAFVKVYSSEESISPAGNPEAKILVSELF